LNRESGLFTGTIAAGNSGKITIDTPQLKLLEGGIFLSPTFSTGTGGNINIRAPQSVDVSGSGLLTTALGEGNAGQLSIDTGKLTIRDQASVSTATFGAGNSGDIFVRATDSVVMLEKIENSEFGTNLSTSTIGGSGKAGNIEITTRSLLLQDGPTIASASGATLASGIFPATGKGGDITINASESVTVTGISDGVPSSRSQIVTATLGNLTPDQLAIFGSPDAGKLRINTKRLIIKDGGGIGGSTVGTGRGGDVLINASESVEISGKTKDGRSPSGIATASGDPLLESFYPGQIQPTGDAGTLNINTDKLILRDGGTVNVESSGTGDPGSINVVAKTIFIDNNYVDIDVPNRKGNIDANTTSGAEGNINLQAQEILLRRGALISTNAGSSDGGNITIKTDILLAVPIENSDITANAQKGSGGRVSITASGIFGLEYQPGLTPKSDITASSDLGPQFNGIVIINIVGTNPSQGVVELPENIVDPSRLIATGCPTNGGNSFVITGRGGLPEDPSQTLRGKTIWQDLRSLEGQVSITNPPKYSRFPITKTQLPIVEATGWLINAKGEVELVAPVTQNSPQTPWFRPANCYTLNSMAR
jgi:large exoprotein involved in heme utilization and adhesion